MIKMPPNKVIRTRVTPEQREAIDLYCQEHGIELSTLIRETILTKIGRKDLSDDVQMGRPPTKADGS